MNQIKKELFFKYNQANRKIRLDKFLSSVMPEHSRKFIQNLINDGCVSCGDNIVNSCSYILKSFHDIKVIIPDAKPCLMTPKTISLNVAFEDEHMLIVDKPAGMTVHPGAGNHDDTLANALMAHCGDSLSGIGGVMRPGIVHRIDKDTSGLLVVAKNDNAHINLSKQIADRTAKRQYLAICWSVPKIHEGVIETNIGRNPNNRKKMAVLPTGGKHATTFYKVEKILNNNIASLVSCKLQTGRTHQIRVHMAHIGNPLVGDQTYCTYRKTINNLADNIQQTIKDFNRQALHSHILGINHPVSGEYIEKTSKLPNDMENLLNVLSA